MQNQSQTLSDAQSALKESMKIPEGFDAPNPELTPSPFPWSGSYVSPAWYGSYKSALGQEGSGSSASNQFSSAVSQPLGLNTDWLGKDRVVGRNQLGGAREPSDDYYNGITDQMRIFKHTGMPSQEIKLKRNFMRGSGKARKNKNKK